jgi:hypothetical protein
VTRRLEEAKVSDDDFEAVPTDTAPTIEVVVRRHGVIVTRVLCESEGEATAVIDQWTEQPGVICEVDDLSVHHRAGQVLEPLEGELVEEDHPPGDPGRRS